MPANAPIQDTVTDKSGLLTQRWVLFFASLIGKAGTNTSAPILTTGAFNPPPMTDTEAANNTIYYSTTASKLVFKDSAGVVHALY